MAEIVKTLPTGTAVEIWLQDEMRVGQKNGLVYQWARKGTRPSQPADQRYVGVALPPLFRRLDAEKPAAPTGPPSPKPRKRRLTPRKRSATPAAKNRIHKSDQ